MRAYESGLKEVRGSFSGKTVTSTGPDVGGGLKMRNDAVKETRAKVAVRIDDKIYRKAGEAS